MWTLPRTLCFPSVDWNQPVNTGAVYLTDESTSLLLYDRLCDRLMDFTTAKGDCVQWHHKEEKWAPGNSPTAGTETLSFHARGIFLFQNLTNQTTGQLILSAAESLTSLKTRVWPSRLST